MAELIIKDLHATVSGKEILKGVNLTVRSGEVHAIMGPNGSGKSTLAAAIFGKPGYTVTSGSVTLDGQDVLAMTTPERAQAGLYFAMQYPVEVPGVRVTDVLTEAAIATNRDPQAVTALLEREADNIGFDREFLNRPMNVDLSGGEKKRNETVQMTVLEPRFAILDELDSGLDVDALRAVSRRIEKATSEGLGDSEPLGVIAITHYNRLLEELKPDVVHVFADGKIQKSGGPEIATELEETGYAEWVTETDEKSFDPDADRPNIDDPFFGGDLL